MSNREYLRIASEMLIRRVCNREKTRSRSCSIETNGSLRGSPPYALSNPIALIDRARAVSLSFHSHSRLFLQSAVASVGEARKRACACASGSIVLQSSWKLNLTCGMQCYYSCHFYNETHFAKKRFVYVTFLHFHIVTWHVSHEEMQK